MHFPVTSSPSILNTSVAAALLPRHGAARRSAGDAGDDAGKRRPLPRQDGCGAGLQRQRAAAAYPRRDARPSQGAATQPDVLRRRDVMAAGAPDGVVSRADSFRLAGRLVRRRGAAAVRAAPKHGRCGRRAAGRLVARRGRGTASGARWRRRSAGAR